RSFSFGQGSEVLESQSRLSIGCLFKSSLMAETSPKCMRKICPSVKNFLKSDSWRMKFWSGSLPHCAAVCVTSSNARMCAISCTMVDQVVVAPTTATWRELPLDLPLHSCPKSDRGPEPV